MHDFLLSLSKKDGFTLVELLIVLTIISILSFTVSVVYTNNLKRSRDLQRITDMENIRTALEQFYIDNGHYPGPSEGVNLAGEVIGDHQGAMDDILSQYMETVPVDPLYNGSNGQNDYFYSYDPQHAQSIEKGCSNVSNHPLYKNDCNCNSSNQAAVFGFNKAELISNTNQLHKDTCAGGDMHLDTSYYNISLFPAPN